MINNFDQIEQLCLNSYQQETNLNQIQHEPQEDIQSQVCFKEAQNLRNEKQKYYSSSDCQQSSSTKNTTDSLLERNLAYLEVLTCCNEEKSKFQHLINKEEESKTKSTQMCQVSSEFLNYIDKHKVDLKLKKKKLSPQEELKRKLVEKTNKNEQQIQDIQFIFNQFKVDIKMSQKQKKQNLRDITKK
ncbi:hypothetical protein ABPG74_012549 [Tetrahymena malaccensis]